MKLGDILGILKDSIIDAKISSLDVQVKGISENSKEIKDGFVFVAVKGSREDGHNFIEDAKNRGAVVFILDDPGFFKWENSILVKDSRRALGVLSSYFFGNPSHLAKVVGITGTNGKTSTAFLLYHLFNNMGFKAGLIGTLGAFWNSNKVALPNTTPSPVLINRIMRTMVENGIKYIFMEVSSHAISQKRIEGINFYCGIFTKGGRDHLDYHRTLESYKNTKKSFFKGYVDRIIVNMDDPWGREIREEGIRDGKNVITVSLRSEKADYRIADYRLWDGGIEGSIRWKDGNLKIQSHLIGEYNLYNILNGVAFSLEEGIAPKRVEDAIKLVPPVPGRLERVVKNVYIDYAHTPDALKDLLLSLRKITRGRIIVVFGCGGDRDKGKRPQMGRIAEKFSDIAIITSDNPRSEDPMMIIDEIASGLEGRVLSEKEIKRLGKGVFANPDRRWVIEFALRLKKEDDIVVIAGKGHEDYMELGGRRIHFSDREVVLDKARKVLGKSYV